MKITTKTLDIIENSNVNFVSLKRTLYLACTRSRSCCLANMPGTVVLTIARRVIVEANQIQSPVCGHF